MVKHLVVMVAVGAAIGVEAARAGTPFGGDDTGFVPPDKETLKCESSVTKNAAKFTLAVSICHDKAADAGVKGKTFDEEACETAARGKYDAANAKLTCPTPCGRSPLHTPDTRCLATSRPGFHRCPWVIHMRATVDAGPTHGAAD